MMNMWEKAKEIIERCGGNVEVTTYVRFIQDLYMPGVEWWYQEEIKGRFANGLEFAFDLSEESDYIWELKLLPDKKIQYDERQEEDWRSLERDIRSLASGDKIKIVLAPTLEEAKKVVSPVATVEAEYGGVVVEGQAVTLAHHVDVYQGNPAPCNSDVERLEGSGTILISHIDLDTLGGVAALLGQKPEHPGFWKAAEFLDLNGSHRILEVEESLRPLFRAYWAYSAQNRLPRFTEATDVTEIVLNQISVVRRILSGDEELIEAGEKWAAELETKQEACLLEEDERVRVFVTQDVPTAAAYYSPAQGRVIPATVTYNLRFGAITIACEGGQFNAREIVQSLWGPEAGGHAGIAGSPRGRKMTAADLAAAVEAVRSA